MKWLHWIHACRLRTLTLASGAILVGSALAYREAHFQAEVFVLTLSTALLLQILSNLANDIGDTLHNIDHAQREGPKRVSQIGSLSKTELIYGVKCVGSIAFLSGIALLYASFRSFNSYFWIFLGIGLAALWSAVRYAYGKKPYGHKGLGDVAVWIFFGWIAVEGTYFLHTHHLSRDGVLLAATIGFLSVAVMNLNNIRDLSADLLAGKRSFASYLGKAGAVRYHRLLLSAAICTNGVWIYLYGTQTETLCALALPWLLMIMWRVNTHSSAQQLDGLLRETALCTGSWALLFSIGVAWSGN